MLTAVLILIVLSLAALIAHAAAAPLPKPTPEQEQARKDGAMAGRMRHALDRATQADVEQQQRDAALTAVMLMEMDH